MRRTGGIVASLMLLLALFAAAPASAVDNEVCHTTDSDTPIIADTVADDIAFTVTGPDADGVYTYVAHTDKGTMTTISGVAEVVTTEDGSTIGGQTIEVGDTMTGLFISLTACYTPTPTETTATTTTTETTTTTAATATTTTTETTTTTAATAATTTTEALPYTGPGDHLAGLAIVGLALIAMGASLLRAARD